MKMAGCNTEEEFYQKYPSEKDFFAAYPHMKGNQTMKMGGAASGHSGSYWNGEKWVSTAGDSGTYANGVYFANGGSYSKMGGPTFMPGGSAPIFKGGGYPSSSFNVTNNEYPTPFAMAPGTGRGSGYLQDLPTHMAFGGITPGAEIVDPFAMYPGTGKGGGMLQDLPTHLKFGGQIPGAELVHPFAMNPGPGTGGGMLQDLPVEMKKGGIYIKPSKRGTFTAAASKHGKSVQAFASQVLAHKENYSPAMVKKANFARNAAKWKHEFGGPAMPDNPGFRALPASVQQKIMSNMQTGGMVTPDRYTYMPGGMYEQGGDFDSEEYTPEMKKGGKWIQSVTASIKRRGTEGVCTGSKFGSSSCPPGSRRYNLAKTFRAMAKNREYGGTAMMQDGGQTNEYANMAIGQMNQMQHKIGELSKVLGQDTYVEPWVASKMTLANDYLNSVENYLQHNPEVQQHMMQGGQFPSFEAYGGYVNPYHPLAKFMAYGGYYLPGGKFGPGDYEEDPTIMPTTPVSAPVTAPVEDPNDLTPNPQTDVTGVLDTPDVPVVDWRKGMTDKQAQENIKFGKGSVQAYDPTTGDTTQAHYDEVERQKELAKKQGRFQKGLNWGQAILGAGMGALGTASYLQSFKDAERDRKAATQRGLSENVFAKVNQPGGHGDYTQQGVFRPDSYGFAKPGYFPSTMGKYGGTFMMGGMPMRDTAYAAGGYVPGSVHEVDDAEIARLRKLGYEVEMM
jgi:hypothetical protein